MLFQVVIENGVKKIVPLTADAGAGNPVGTIIPMYKKSSPSGYLYCDGSTFDETAYPLLYAYLGTNVLPDYREFALVGAEENTTDVYNASTNPTGTIHDHDVYTEGESKDDQLQDHSHSAETNDTKGNSSQNVGFMFQPSSAFIKFPSNGFQSGRKGTVTRGKRKAVYFYIKATSGLSENAQDNVLATINENNSYSTTEHATGKKWIDGKDIYSKVLPATLFTKDVQLNIQIGTNIDKGWVDFTHSYIYNTNGSFSGQRQPWNQTQMFVEGNNFFFTTGHSDFSNTTYIVAVVEYTKTV
jgi:microcystin-dependent protein